MKNLTFKGLLLATVLVAGSARAEQIFVPGNLVVSVSGAGVMGGTASPYADNAASPLTLFQFSHAGTSSAAYVSATVLRQTASGANSAISAEYGSSSEGTLQLTADGKHLTIAGYGVNAAAFNSSPTTYGTAVNNPNKPTALGQSGSLTGQSYTGVPRVIAVIGANGSVDTTTALTGVFNGNNPRSVYSADGTSFYVSGQGTGSDATGGVFYTTLGATTATAISGLDTSGKTVSQDTRDVQIHDGQLYVSVDSKGGSNSARSFIGTLGAMDQLPTTVANDSNGPTMLPGYGNTGGTGKYAMTAANGNGLNTGKQINLSPESFFFASDTVLYVADSGASKQTSATSTIGDGGLQKWTYAGGTWTLQYTLSLGLNLVLNTAASGTTGLFGLTGQVVGDQVELFATNYTIGDTDQTYLFGITDALNAIQRPSGEAFTLLATAPKDSNFKGVAFAPTAVPEPQAWALMILGAGLVGGVARRRRAAGALA